MKNSDVARIKIDDLGKSIGILTAATFCLSVVFDWGYLEALGLSFSVVPTTIADHVRDALLWVPGTLSAALGYTLLELMGRRIERGLTEDELINNSKNPNRTAWLRRSPYKLFVVFAITIIFLNYLFGDAFARGMSMASPFMMYEVIRWSFAHKRVTDSVSPVLRRAITFIVPLIFFIYFQGYSKGVDQLIEKPSILLTLSAPIQLTEVTLLRQMEKGILVKDVTGKAIFYRWEVVKSFSEPVVSPIKRNRVCRWFNALCNINP